MRQLVPSVRRCGTIRDLLAAARERAYRRLTCAIGYPIALVCAPPGFGKSTVTRDLLAARATPYRLVTLEPRSTDLLGFLRALAGAVADDAPALALSFAAVHDRVAAAADAIDQLADWAARSLVALDGLIVVDGFATADDSAASAFLTALIDRTAGHVRWIVLAQRGDAFPVARWQAENRMGDPVDADDLALGEADFAAATQRDVAPDERRWLREMCARTGGWPASIALALAAGAAVEWASAPHESEPLYAVLADAALHARSARSRRFIEATCLFEEFDPTLLACAGMTDSAEMLSALCDEGVLLAPRANGALAYDRQIRRFVCARLRARGDGEFERLLRRAALANEHAGRFAAAIEQWLELGEISALCALLGAHGFALVDGGEAGAVQRALAAIPHDVLLSFPTALAVKAGLESLHGRADVAEAWFRLALARIDDSVARSHVVYRFVIDLVRRERRDAIEIVTPVVATLDPESPFAAPLLGLLASACASAGRLADAADAIARALQLLPHVADAAQRAKVVFQSSFVALHLLEIERARTLAAQAYREACAAHSYDVAARALSVLYSIAIDHDDDIGASRAYIDQLADAAGRAGSRQLLLYATLCRYEIEVFAGRTAAIERLDEQLASLEVFYTVLTTETLVPAQALQATWSGDFARAYSLVESSADHQVSPGRRAGRLVEIAVYAAAAGLAHRATAAADEALAILRAPADDRAVSPKAAVHIQSYAALAFVLLRRPGRAGKLLRDLDAQSIDNARSLLLVRAIRVLADRWVGRSGLSALVAVLEELDAADLGGIARMIEALPLPTPRSTRHRTQLNASERETLRRLAAGDTSADTRLVASACRKLGCRGWREAIALA